MTASELKYLIAIAELCEQNGGAKLTAIAERLGVSKVSAYNAAVRLEGGGLAGREGKRFYVTEKGRAALAEYVEIIRFISAHLERHCGTAQATAYNDALVAACVLSPESRKGIAEFIRSGRSE